MEAGTRRNAKKLKKKVTVKTDSDTIKRSGCDCCKCECELPPEYLKINGFWYEKIDFDTVGLPLELEDSTIDRLTNYAQSHGFISTKEALRYLVREMMESDKHLKETSITEHRT